MPGTFSAKILRTGWGTCCSWLAAVAALAAPGSSQAQVDTPAAREARAALRTVQRMYANRQEWLSWSPLLNVPDLRYELRAGDRAEADTLRAAILHLLDGSVHEFSRREFVRLATALDVRAQELAWVPAVDWPSACREEAERFAPPTPELLAAARGELARRMDQFEVYYPDVRDPGNRWSEFLYWSEMRDLATPPTPAAPPDRLALDRLEIRWAAAPAVWDDELLFETTLVARAYLRQLRGYLKGETRAQHAAAWHELAELVGTASVDEPARRRIAAAIAARESLGEASRLTASVRRALSQPNLVVRVDRKWLESRFVQQIDEPFDVDGVFAGTRSVGRGRTVGSIWAEMMPSRAVGQWRLRLRGESTSRASGGQDRVFVSSRASTQVSATKPFVLDTSGLAPQRASAGALTSIDYESISARGLARRRSAAVSETYARRPAAEADSAAYARRSVLDQINREAGRLADEFNRSYHEAFRDPRINALRPGPVVRVRGARDAMRWECLLEGPATFAAPAPPPAFEAGEVVVSLAASALEEQMAVDLGGRQLTSDELLERIGAAGQGISPGDSFSVTFADHPCDVRLADGAVHTRLHVTHFDSADVQYPAMTVTVSYRPEQRDGKPVLARQGRVRVMPESRASGEKPRISGRQQTLRVAVERKLAKVLSDELPWPDLSGPLVQPAEGALRLSEARVAGPWLQVALRPDGAAAK